MFNVLNILVGGTLKHSSQDCDWISETTNEMERRENLMDFGSPEMSTSVSYKTLRP